MQLFHITGPQAWSPQYFVVADDQQHATQLVYQSLPEAEITDIVAFPFNTVIAID